MLASRRETHRAQWLLEDELLATALKRAPTTLEARLLYREPRCGVCWDRECDVEAREGGDEGARGWRLCGTCRVMVYCCAAHEAEGKEEHTVARGEDGRTQCEAFVLSNEVDEFHLRHAILHPPTPQAPATPPKLWVPPRVLEAPAPLPRSWAEYLEGAGVPSVTRAEVYGVFVEALAPVLSILAALRRLDATATPSVDQASSVSIWLLEQDPTSAGGFLPAFEELAHQLPALKTIDLTLLSPDNEGTKPQPPAPLPVCPACSKAGRTRSLSSRGVSSPAVLQELEKPSLLFALSTSLPGEDPDAITPFWAAVLAHCKTTSVPLVVACNTAEEAQEALARCAEQGLEVRWDVERNVWSGGRPWVDLWEEDGLWRVAGWWFAVGAPKDS